MENDVQTKLATHKNLTSVSSSIALGAAGIAAFTTAFPVVTGVLVGTGLLSSGVAAYNFYQSLEDEKRGAACKTL